MRIDLVARKDRRPEICSLESSGYNDPVDDHEGEAVFPKQQ
jgi:hypothetical protein